MRPFRHNNEPSSSDTNRELSSSPLWTPPSPQSFESRTTSSHYAEDRKGKKTAKGTIDELTRYLDLLSTEEDSTDNASLYGLSLEEVLTTPLFSWSAKLLLAEAGEDSHFDACFEQFALLGRERQRRVPGALSTDAAYRTDPIFLNTNAPWSAFLCGSQGSGKSYTLACMLEGCLLPSRSLGSLSRPLQGIVFHYDAWSVGSVCEAAYLCSAGISVNVLVSPSNYWKLKDAYQKIGQSAKYLTVRKLRLQPKHLNVERMLSLMAFNEVNGKIPLYMEVRCVNRLSVTLEMADSMQVINKILRSMATSGKRHHVFDYKCFISLLKEEKLSRDQKGPMNLRLELLESFMETTNANVDDFKPAAGSLTIVDLTDPFIDASTACVLFDICLSLFLEEKESAGRVIALDEAHKV